IEAARQEVRRRPRSGEAWGHLGEVLADNGYHAPAATCFGHAARFDPDNPRWPYLHALELLDLGSTGEALPLVIAANAVAKTREEQGTTLYWIVWMMVEEGRVDEAAEYVRALTA